MVIWVQEPDAMLNKTRPFSFLNKNKAKTRPFNSLNKKTAKKNWLAQDPSIFQTNKHTQKNGQHKIISLIVYYAQYTNMYLNTRARDLNM